MYDDIELAFFDYDRTLITHPIKTSLSLQMSYKSQCYLELVKQAELHDGDKPVPAMLWLVSECRSRNIECFTLTHEIFNLRDELKKNMAKRYYGITNYLTVSEAEHKIDMIKAVAMARNVKPSQCLFVDDKMDLVYLACKNDIAGVHISNICQQYESRHHGMHPMWEVSYGK